MKRGWIAAVAVAVIAGGIIVYKGVAPKRPVLVPPPRSSAHRATPSVLAFVDPREKDEVGGCGDILRLLHNAHDRGISVREVPPGSDRALEKRYHVTVSPTVLVLGSNDVVVSRLQGESPQTIDALRASLRRLQGATK